MDGKKNKIIIMVVFIIILAIICLAFFAKNKDNKTSTNNNTVIENNEPVQEILTTEQEDGTKVNISSVIKDALFEIDGLKITNITLSKFVGMTEIAADVKNESEQTRGDIMLTIKLLDKDGAEMVEVAGYIGTLKSGDTSKLNASAPLDYSEAYSIQIEKR